MRETGPVGKKYRKPEDAVLMPLARTQLGLLKNALLKKGKVPTGTLARYLPDGSYIRVDSRHGVDRVFIETPDHPSGEPVPEMFLESGYLALAASVGAIFWTEGLQQDAFEQQTYLDYMYGYAETFRTREYEEPPLISIPNRSGLVNVSRAAALYANANWGALPGKTRLYFQALVGSKREPQTNTPGMYLTGAAMLTLTHEQSKALSYNLYTSSQNKYFLIKSEEVGDDNVKLSYAEIKFTPAGKALLDVMRVEFPDFQAASAREESDMTSLEAYLFTQGSALSEWVEIDTFECIGTPLALSWNTNWNGTEAVMVAHEFVPYAAGGPTFEYVTARTYRYELDEDDDGNPASVDVDMEEEVNWTPVDSQVFWEASVDPVSGVPGMRAWEPNGCAGEFPDVLSSDAPVYAFYSDAEDRITMRSTVEPTNYGSSALDRLTAWRRSKTCRQTAGEGIFLNNGYRTGLYFTEEPDGATAKPKDSGTRLMTPGLTGAEQAMLQAESGTSGYGEGYAFSITGAHSVGPRCLQFNCPGYVESECTTPWDPATPCSPWTPPGHPSSSYCNTSVHGICPGTSNAYIQYECATVVGYDINLGAPSANTETFGLIPFHTAEAAYISQGHRVYSGAFQTDIWDNLYVDNLTPYINTGGYTSCTPAPNGPTEFACVSAEGYGLGSGTGGCCTHNNVRTTKAQTMYTQEMWLVTRSFTEEIENEVTFADGSVDIALRDYASYIVFYEPGWIMCFNPYTRYHPTLIKAPGSAVQSEWVYDGAWGGGTRDTQTTVTGDTLDGSGYNGIWSGRI